MDNEADKKRALEKLKHVKPRNYWNTSGANKDSFPTKPDKNSIPKRVKKKDRNGNVKVRIPVEPKNPWWIDSKQDNYDFWVWLDRNSAEDGSMEPMQQSEIGKLFGCSATKIHFIIKQAIQKLINNGQHHVLADFLKADTSPDGDYIDVSQFDSEPDNDI